MTFLSEFQFSECFQSLTPVSGKLKYKYFGNFGISECVKAFITITLRAYKFSFPKTPVFSFPVCGVKSGKTLGKLKSHAKTGRWLTHTASGRFPAERTKHMNPIITNLAAMLDGNASPSVKTDDSTDLIAAMSEALNDQRILAQIGMQVVALLSDRLRASMAAEREVALLKGFRQ
ncbi:MAG: hypothetical protein KAX57_03475 [Rhodoferax sp.]|jgi:hypothetical protein|uniref:hypothetical protein n=1 Tax=Rhodoferax sp. TaxID=50421 RepID=UPI001B52A239|nr:hypothetical protein [Rhodoferax sp.]MBP8285880.1 hypothetical protein [Rhodoferax sp.]MBP9734309.1 hypothetical protein [Rhodoferax sp.]